MIYIKVKGNIMEERKRRKTRTKQYKDKRKHLIMKSIRYVIGFIIISILLYMTYGIYQEAKIRTVNKGENGDLLSRLTKQNGSDTEENQIESQIEHQKNKQEAFTPVVEKYAGYLVDSRLEVPKINLKTNVLADYTKAGLKVCASKYYGPNANEIGNYCIAGHNYQKENMFNHLIDLEIGDSVFLTDNKNGKIEYTIYDIYKVKPENVEPLSQETRERKEITLITCVNYSKNRLVVKAVEKKS